MVVKSLPSLSSARIILRRFIDADLPALVAYRNDKEVARYQSWSPLNEQQARLFIDELRDAEPGRRGEWFSFAIALKKTNELIGDCAFKVNADDTQQAEIGYTLARAFHGQGYASEAVATLITYIFEQHEIHRTIAQVDCRNQSSIALLKRLGLRCEGHFLQSFWLKGEWIDEYLFAVLAAEWRARQANQ